ncbi:MAG TPA: hypothetical protein PK307_13960 [Spirochaetota bacterium]|nr:hypothetical protein [Spirochaetota bacterium]HOD13387.1 hypothetical protein [Spirochaetota bacterium]HPG50569.1 hypothetical protein [Spirochaetota bacterium]HPN11858.1 hypothetical protein [Spirochaetota bacterium]HQL83305.1 hypothetical protein [Spirochaetota bacterium]
MKVYAFALLVVMAMVPAAALEDGGADNRVILDKKFFSDFQRTPAVLRDGFLDERMNTIIQGRGQVRSIEKIQRYKKRFRVVLVDLEAEKLNLKVLYYIYIDSKTSISMLKTEESMEFSGQLVAYTPVNSRRDGYIFDVIFEKGAMLVE